jgi:hypothetical protein
MPKFTVEYTDTFGGEANYSWVRRHKFTAKANSSRRTLLRRAKSLVGLSNWRGRVEDYGDMLAFKPFRSNTVLFVTYSEE